MLFNDSRGLVGSLESLAILSQGSLEDKHSEEDTKLLIQSLTDLTTRLNELFYESFLERKAFQQEYLSRR